jgi:hypothetical protein
MEKTFFLGRGDTVALIRGAGTTVAVIGGYAWITQHGDINDYVVRDGSWQVKLDGLVLIHAFQACRVALAGPAGAKAQVRRRGEIELAAA